MKSGKFLPSLVAAMLVLVSTAASAHAHLEKSVPADKSRVATLQQIELTFSEDVVLTGLTLQRGTAPAQSIQALSPESASGFVVPVQIAEPGDYVVTWSAATDDGHVATGRFRVTLAPAADRGKSR